MVTVIVGLRDGVQRSCRPSLVAGFFFVFVDSLLLLPKKIDALILVEEADVDVFQCQFRVDALLGKANFLLDVAPLILRIHFHPAAFPGHNLVQLVEIYFRQVSVSSDFRELHNGRSTRDQVRLIILR